MDSTKRFGHAGWCGKRKLMAKAKKAAPKKKAVTKKAAPKKKASTAKKAAPKKAAKKAAPKKAAAKKSTSKKAAPRKAASKKKAAAKKGGKKNKLGVKNSLVNNINARKEKGASRSKSKSTVSKKSYKDMKDNWGEGK